MFRAIALSASLLCASVAAPALAVTKDGEKVASAEPSRKTCRSILKTGSRLGVQKICKTVSEWTEYDKVNQRDTDEAMNRTRGNCSGATSGCSQ